MTGQIIYLACAVTSLACTVLLLKRWRTSRSGLLFWSAGCFLTLTAANILLFIDRTLTPAHVDLAVYRHAVTLLAVIFMIWGLIMGRKGG